MNTAELIRKIAHQNRTTVVRTTVVSVNESECTADCKLLSDDADIFDVKINAKIQATKGIRIIPAVSSIVYLIFEDDSNTEAFIALYSEIDKILIDTEEIIFNGGENGGLINIEDLVVKINTIEEDLNSLKNVFSTWIPVVQDGGAALKSAAGSWAGQTITTTTIEDFEDPKIKH